MDWNEAGILMSIQPHGESGLVAQMFTQSYGRHAGFVSGGNGRRQKPLFQPGNYLQVSWRGRLSEHLGNFTCEPLGLRASDFLDDPLRLGALNAAMTLLATTLPEREPHPNLYDATLAWLEGLSGPYWGETLVLLEVRLLDVLGFGLDLSSCAATGLTEELDYVSPRSGRAVSREAAEPYKDKLLKLPGFLVGRQHTDLQSVYDGLQMTGYFFEKYIFHAQNKPLPEAHGRLTNRLQRALDKEAAN